MTDFKLAFAAEKLFLMEGELGERLRREFHLRFHDRIAMAALVRTEEGRAALQNLWREYRAAANAYHLPFLAATPTRRANRERMSEAGEGEALIGENVRFLKAVRELDEGKMYIGGLMGCRGDAYTGWGALDTEAARTFHAWQAEAFARSGADFLMAGIMPAVKEAMGMARAMAETGLPYIVSLTIRRDGRLIDGTPIDEAIARIDEYAKEPPLCLMTNCVHPSVVREALMQPFNRTARVKRRFLGIQANTSPLDYSLLDGAKELFASEPEELADEMTALHDMHPMRIIGGCCGTDGRHIRAMAGRLCEKRE